MPTYQYACTACDHRLEAVQSFADDPLTECPVCEGRLRKLFGSVGIVFKGPGFYRTDSRASASSNGQKDDPKQKPTGEAGGKDGGGKDKTPVGAGSTSASSPSSSSSTSSTSSSGSGSAGSSSSA